MAIELTDNQITRILYLVSRQFDHISADPSAHYGDQEFFWAGFMKPERFDVKLGWSKLNDCFVAWDYKAGEAERFIAHCMDRTKLVVEAKVEDGHIWVMWNKWRPMYEYRLKRSIPARPMQKKVVGLFRLNAGFPACIEISLKF